MGIGTKGLGAYARGGWVLLLTAGLLYAPGLRSGWLTDDHWHRASLTSHPELPHLHRPPSRLFDFTGRDTGQVGQYIADGLLPWWADPELKLSFSRPLSGLTHAADYVMWPASPLAMHFHSFIWCLALVFAVLALYRRLLPTTALAGLGALLYLADDALALPTLWIANRNSLVGAALGVAALLCYHRWRRDGWKPGAALAPLALLAAVLGNEGAVAVGGYLLAYAIFLDSAPIRSRIFALLPCTAVGVGWALWYRISGFGATGSALYVDPGAGLTFLEALAQRVPLLFWGQWSWPGADVAMILGSSGQVILWWMGVVLAAGVATSLLPLLRRHPEARFLGLGMILALLPACATFPSNRLLLFSGLGASGLIAMLMARWIDVARGRESVGRWRRRLAGTGAALLILVHGVLPPLTIHPTMGSMAQLEATVQAAAASLPRDASVVDQDVVVVLTSSSFVSLLASVVHADLGQPRPRSLLQLSAGIHGATVRRPAASTLVIAPRGGYLRPSGLAVEGVPAAAINLQEGMTLLEGLFRDVGTRPFAVGDRISFAGITAEVRSVMGGRPQEVAFHFDEPLEAERWRFVFRSGGPYQPFPVPPVGGEVVLDGTPGRAVAFGGGHNREPSWSWSSSPSREDSLQPLSPRLAPSRTHAGPTHWLRRTP